MLRPASAIPDTKAIALVRLQIYANSVEAKETSIAVSSCGGKEAR